MSFRKPRTLIYEYVRKNDEYDDIPGGRMRPPEKDKCIVENSDELNNVAVMISVGAKLTNAEATRNLSEIAPGVTVAIENANCVNFDKIKEIRKEYLCQDNRMQRYPTYLEVQRFKFLASVEGSVDEFYGYPDGAETRRSYVSGGDNIEPESYSSVADAVASYEADNPMADKDDIAKFVENLRMFSEIWAWQFEDVFLTEKSANDYIDYMERKTGDKFRTYGRTFLDDSDLFILMKSLNMIP